MGFFRRGLTQKEKEWLTSIRTQFADPIYRRIYAKLLQCGRDETSAAEMATERTIQAFEKLAEEAMSVDWFHFKRRVLFTDPDKTWKFLLHATSFLSDDEQQFIIRAEEQLTFIFGANRYRIPDNDADDARQTVLLKLEEYILKDPANFEALQNEAELEKWLSICLSNVVGYETPHRMKNNYTSGTISKTRQKNAREIPILTPEDAEIYRGVTLDDTRLSREEKAFQREGDYLSEQDEYSLQLLKQESIEVQTMMYLFFVMNYTPEEICRKMGLTIKPASLSRQLNRKIEELEQKVIKAYPAERERQRKKKTPKGGSPPDENR